MNLVIPRKIRSEIKLQKDDKQIALRFLLKGVYSLAFNW